MKKWIIAFLAALFTAAACQKPFVTGVDLGVNNETIHLLSFEEGHCFITVFSNGSWNIALEPAVSWARLDRASGSGIQYVRLDYDENFDPSPRSVRALVSGQGKTCEIEIIQPGQ